MRPLRAFALLAAVPVTLAVALTAPAHADSVHYACTNVAFFPMLVNRPVLGTICTGPAVGGPGTVTRTTDGVTFACSNLTLQSGLLHGQNCGQLF